MDPKWKAIEAQLNFAKRYSGMGVFKAVRNIEELISPKIPSPTFHLSITEWLAAELSCGKRV
jgi:hypothetical protein